MTNRNHPNNADIAALACIVGVERCQTGAEINVDYAHDELSKVSRPPDVVVRVKSADEIAAVMRLANERGIPVVVRGSGTGLVGGAVAIEGGIVIDTTLMNRIVELDKDNMTITVEAGVLLMTLAEFVERNGFLYPPDPGEKSATIGGNINTNAGGMRAVKYGVTRDYVLGLTVVLPDGEIMRLGGKTVKNTTGYSLKDCIVGSEGTLAVVAEAILRLVPLPPHSVSLLLPFPDMDTALDTAPEILRTQATPTAVEYMARETIECAEKFLEKKFPDTSSPAYLLLTFDGHDKDAVEAAYVSAAEFCMERGALDAFVIDTLERKKEIWGARGAFLEGIKASTSEMDECDVVVPRSALAEYIKFSHTLSKEIGLRLPGFGHAGDGNVHIYLCRDELSEEAWNEKMTAVFDQLYAKAAEMGGFVSGEHGIGFAKKKYLQRQLGDAQIKLMRRFKHAFDPAGILNPGKICM